MTAGHRSINLSGLKKVKGVGTPGALPQRSGNRLGCFISSNLNKYDIYLMTL
jgi:hypothetical protein